ncbi:MAG: four helix bundle suffix domain-containing protein [Alistipes sp.]|nr:four helix bundle suffix domain-containing protein [Alistipes sp.]
MQEKVFRNRRNYKKLLCYIKAETIYDITYLFANKFLQQSDRTIDQMVQAARSGKQNIIEGYAAGATSSASELKLLNVAKSSLQELLADYEDYLRTRGLHQWKEDSVEFTKAQELGKEHDDSAFWMGIVSTRSDETIANIAIILLHQTDYLLYKFMETISHRFVSEGGFREKLSHIRRAHKDIKSTPSAPNAPNGSNAPLILFPTELEASRLRVVRPDLDIRICGVGVVNVALCIAEIIADERPNAIVLCGIAGAYSDALQIGDVVGVATEHLAGMPDAYKQSYHSNISFDGVSQVVSNTVQSVGMAAGDALIENMEGAMLFALCRQHKIRCGEIRAISNYVNTPRSEWKIELATEHLAAYLAELF